MFSYFELCQARTWALCTLNNYTDNIHVHLSLKDVDPVSIWFLRQVPQYSGSILLRQWRVINDDKDMVYSNEIGNSNANVCMHLYIKLFVDSNSLYVGLYDKDGNRWCDACLVIWLRNRPHVTNPGYAPGRCPDTCDTIDNH